jgi:Sulfotransferase family
VQAPSAASSGLRRRAWSAALYGQTAGRLLVRGRRAQRAAGDRTWERMVFVVGSPRSGTTFVGRSLGAQPGFLDLGEVKPLKAAIPELAGLPEDEAGRRLRRALDRLRRLGLVGHLRGVEQTPETCFVLGAALDAYPEARAVHVLRDGRDVVCSLLERGWLSTGQDGRDDVGLPFGLHTRFWVEPGREDEFGRASDASRAAWAWRRHVTAARAVAERTLELRYEEIVAAPGRAAERVAEHLDGDRAVLETSFRGVHDRSLGRWRRDLGEAQLEDVEREAGPLLRELGYV